MQIPYVDIHTHKVNVEKKDKSTIYLLNHQWHEPLPDHPYLCASLHPWSLPDSVEEGQQFLSQSFTNEQYIALGEIGLDKKNESDWNTQHSHYIKALQFAKNNSVPVVVLHSVKAHAECIAGILNEKVESAIIFHDYYGSIQQTKEILSHNNFFISLGSILKRPKSKLYEYIKDLPLDKVFLETDDSELSIEEVYSSFCLLTGRNIDEVKSSCYNNLMSIFPGTICD